MIQLIDDKNWAVLSKSSISWKFDEIWSILIKFGQFDEIWVILRILVIQLNCRQKLTGLFKIDQNWSNLIKTDNFWWKSSIFAKFDTFGYFIDKVRVNWLSTKIEQFCQNRQFHENCWNLVNFDQNWSILTKLSF